MSWSLQAALVEEEQVCQPRAEPDQSGDEGPGMDPIEALSDKHSDMVIEVLLRMLDWIYM